MSIRARAGSASRRMRQAIAVLAIAVTAGGCGAGQASSGSAARASGGPAARVATASSSSSPPAPVAPPSGPVGKLCGYPDAAGRLTTIKATDGVRLGAIQVGSGPRGVVLIPELGMEGKCGWWQYAASLAAHGFNVVAIDHRCKGDSDCPSGPAGYTGSAASAPAGLMADIYGAVRTLRAAGAVKVALVGGSQGAAEALIAATRPQPGVTGVAALSADELTLPLATSPYPATAQAAAPALRLPVLMAVASADSYISGQDTQRLYASVGSRSKRLVVLGSEAGHGWDMVDADGPGLPPPAFAGTLTAFLREVTAVPAVSSSTVVSPAAAGSPSSVDGWFSAAQDPYDCAPAARQFLAAAPGTARRLLTVPGTDHGTALLSGQSGATTIPAVTGFLRQVLGG
jgi:pimeloyl-ACP methyl ester carboxylesterase